MLIPEHCHLMYENTHYPYNHLSSVVFVKAVIKVTWPCPKELLSHQNNLIINVPFSEELQCHVMPQVLPLNKKSNLDRKTESSFLWTWDDGPSLKVASAPSHSLPIPHTLNSLTNWVTHTPSMLGLVTVMSPCPLAFHPAKTQESRCYGDRAGTLFHRRDVCQPGWRISQLRVDQQALLKAELLFLGLAVALLSRVQQSQTYTFQQWGEDVCVCVLVCVMK